MTLETIYERGFSAKLDVRVQSRCYRTYLNA